jgi:hypothetical protein
MNQLILPLLCALLPLPVFAGCTPLDVAHLYNNSGADRRLLMEAQTHPLPRNTAWAGNWLEGARELEVHSVRDDAPVIWKYDWQRVPREFGSHFWTRTDYQLQLEPDGSIYVVGPKEKLPAKSFGTQPPGWPMKPEAH